LDASYLEDGDSTVTAANWYGARMEPLKIDIKIKNIEETFKVGAGRIVAHHCPGHSPGSLVYLAELDSNLVLFGQDVHGPLDAAFLSNRDDYKRSLKFLAGLDADILCEGHFGVYQGKNEVNQFIRTYLDG
jgi:glyoxylase-like metal-dependent hydrolase (beta-lactamase superfamily II)